MHWYTFAANMARAIALVTAINVPLAVLLIFLARRKEVEQPHSAKEKTQEIARGVVCVGVCRPLCGDRYVRELCPREIRTATSAGRSG